MILGIALLLFQAPKPAVVPFNASGIYDLHSRVGWTISMPKGEPGPSGSYSYTLKKNNQELIKGGTIEFTAGKATIETTGDEPAMLYLEIVPSAGGRHLAYGAAVAPTRLRPSLRRPTDFDAFWRSKISVLEQVSPNPVLTPVDSGQPDVDLQTLQMDNADGTHIYGHLAKPRKPGKLPALLILQWASPPYPLDRSWAVGPATQGWLTLNLEPHDVLPDGPRSYYSSLPPAIKHYESIGQDDRDKSYFLRMYLGDYRAVDYLTSLPEWDGKTLVVMGGSMGGQQSLCVAGLHPKVTHVIVEEPAGCDLNGPLHGRQIGYPFFPPNNPKVMETAQYFDAVNFAPHIRATSLVAMGFIDTIAPPAGIWTAFNQIRGRKEAAPMVDAPHNNIATAEQQLPYYSRSAAWLDALVHGRPVEVGRTPASMEGRRNRE